MVLVVDGVMNQPDIKTHSKRSQVHGSTFRVKDRDGIEDPKSSSKRLIFPGNCKLAPNLGFGLTHLTLFSYIRTTNAVREREWNPWPRPGMSRCGGGKPSP